MTEQKCLFELWAKRNYPRKNGSILRSRNIAEYRNNEGSDFLNIFKLCKNYENYENSIFYRHLINIFR